MKLTVPERETAAAILASTFTSAGWCDLTPFTRAAFRTKVLTLERIFEDLEAGRAALAKGER